MDQEVVVDSSQDITVIANVTNSPIEVTSDIVGVIGPKGDTGPSNVLNIGSVTKGDDAEATITGTSPEQTLNLVLPKGDTGEKGDTGAQGELGPQGIQGVIGPRGLQGPQGIQGIQGIQGVEGTKYIWRGAWSSGVTNYAVNDCISYNGSGYICVKAGVNKQPNLNPTYWNILVEQGDTGVKGVGFNYVGWWSSGIGYHKGDAATGQDRDIVSDGGTSLYACYQDHTSSSNFQADVMAGKWSVFLPNGDPFWEENGTGIIPSSASYIFTDGINITSTDTYTGLDGVTISDNHSNSLYYVLGLHSDDSSPWSLGVFLDGLSSTVPVFAYFAWDSNNESPVWDNDSYVAGDFAMGTPRDNNIGIYINDHYERPEVIIGNNGSINIGYMPTGYTKDKFQIYADQYTMGELNANYIVKQYGRGRSAQFNQNFGMAFEDAQGTGLYDDIYTVEQFANYANSEGDLDTTRYYYGVYDHIASKYPFYIDYQGFWCDGNISLTSSGNSFGTYGNQITINNTTGYTDHSGTGVSTSVDNDTTYAYLDPSQGLNLYSDTMSIIMGKTYPTTITQTGTAPRAIALPNNSGTIALTSDITSGNSATTTKLATARKINGVNFDGTADINPVGGRKFIDAVKADTAGIDAAPTAGRVYLSLVQVLVATTLTGIRVHMGTVASGNVTAGLYGPVTADNPNGAAVVIQASCTQDQYAATVGAPQDIPVASTAIAAGRYYIAVEFDNNTARYMRCSNYNFGNEYTGYYARGGGYGALTDPCPSWTATSTSIPKLTLITG